MNKRNYQKELDEIINKECVGKKPTLLLHSCCAPCSSYCLEYLNQYFDITIIYYNPNISKEEEFRKRVDELKKLLKLNNMENQVKIVVPLYDNREFFDVVKGLENEPERGKRCYVCYELRLKRTALLAKEQGFDYFATTLSISPYKNAEWLNEIGERLGEELGVKYLVSDFKKKNGYKRSIELSEEYDLYRQDYCGCIYSQIERNNKKNNEKN